MLTLLASPRASAALARQLRHAPHCAGMATPDPLGLDDDTLTLPSNAVQQVERALFDRAIGVTVSKDVMTGTGPVTLDTELPADVKAAQTFLQAHAPERYRDDRPQQLVQFVVALPPRSSNATEWLRDIGRGQSLLPVADAPRHVPTARGSVPDPLGVPAPLVLPAITVENALGNTKKS